MDIVSVFKKKNDHHIVSKRDQKYEMFRDKLTTYRNFSDIYDPVIEEMCEASVTEKLDYPVWMNRLYYYFETVLYFTVYKYAALLLLFFSFFFES